jgi:glycerophosphoryl diester phosphodiesterase
MMSDVNPWVRPGRPLTLAHRGHSTTIPEQTMAAYRAAIAAGVDAIEVDVHLTRDRHLVLLHDETLDRTTDGRGPVAEHTLAEVRALDAGNWFEPRFAGERVPTLDQLLDLAAEAGIFCIIEVKGGDHEQSLRIAHATADRLAERGELERHVVSSFDQVALGVLRQRHPTLDVAPDRLPEVGFLPPEAVVAQARTIGARVMQVLHTEISRELVEAHHAADIALWSWTVNTDAEIAASKVLGCDGLMGDDAHALVRAVRP